jgi:uncharacterized protein YndB with AHSA1/START domain
LTEAALTQAANEIVVDEVFPHLPTTIWRALTSGDLINRWLMAQRGFEPRVGNHFSFQTPPTDDWDGVIHCEIVEFAPPRRLVYTWKSGVQTNEGYVPRLDTLVTWTLTPHDSGTRLRIVHSGFDLPRNESTFRNISTGWPRIVPKLIAIAAELA